MAYATSKASDQPVHTHSQIRTFEYSMTVKLLAEQLKRRLHPRGGTLIFPYIHRLGSFLGVQNFDFQYIWEFKKKKIFLGVWIFLGVAKIYPVKVYMYQLDCFLVYNHILCVPTDKLRPD